MSILKKITVLTALSLIAGSLYADGFNNLFRISAPNGDCQICPRGKTEFEPVLKGKAYPLGAVVKTGKSSDVVILLSDSDAVRLMSDTVVNTELHSDGFDGKIINLKEGTILVRVNAANTNNSIVVTTPVAQCASMIGNAKFSLSSTQLDTSLEIRAEASSQMKIVGPQFVIPNLKNGNGAVITTFADNSMTRIRDLFGDYKVFVNKGTEINPDTTEGVVSEVLLPVTMSTQSAVKIWRENAPVGGRLIVSVLATAPDGKGRESYAFAVGKDNVVTRSNVFDLPPLSPEDTADGEEGANTADSNTADLFAEPASTETDEAAPAATEEAPAETKDDSLDEFLF